MRHVPEVQPRPLTGIRVVTSANALPTAIVGQVLADAGAEVWLLEPPEGSRLRTHPAWKFWARGQRSLRVDLTRADDQARARALVAASDVFVDGWGTGVATRLGLDADDLRATNPRLVHARISAFGDDSPLAALKGWESIVMAAIGGSTSFGLLTSRPGPTFVSTPFCSVSAAHHALQGILGALVERERSGAGQAVAVSLAHSFLAYDTWNWLLLVLADRYERAFESAPPFDTLQLIPNTPFVFRLLVALSADGQWLQFSQTTDRLWEAFLRTCDLDPDDPAVHDAPLSEDPAVRVAFWEQLLAAVRSRTADEWLDVFDREPDVWADTFRAGPSALTHPQLLADSRVVRDEHGHLMPAELAQSERWAEFTIAPPPELGADDAAAADVTPTPIPARARAAATITGEPALAGVTVVELGSFFAAPFGATLVAEQGARVIKVEPPEGDAIRNLMPFPDLAGIKVLQGKQSVVLDLDDAAERAVFEALIRGADVVLQGYRAGVAERMRVTADDLHALNPELVYVSSPGYGSGPPCGRKPAFAPTMGAASGLAVRNIGGVDCLPVGADLELDDVKRTSIRLAAGAMGPANADGFAALGVGTAMLLGLVGQVRHGGGNVLRTSMLSTVALALADSNIDVGAPPRTDVDPELLGVSPWHRLYRTADGWLMVAALAEEERAALAECAGCPLDTTPAGGLESFFAAAPTSDLEARLRAAGVTCVEVVDEAADRHVTLGRFGAEHGWVTTAHHALLDEYPRVTAYTTFSRSSSVLGPAPTLGQHTDAVLAEFPAGSRVPTA